MMICVFYYFFVGKFGNSKKRATFAPQLQNNCPDGGIGRRAGLKHQWSKIHPGSTPGLGTRIKDKWLENGLSFSSFQECSHWVPIQCAMNDPVS